MVMVLFPILYSSKKDTCFLNGRARGFPQVDTTKYAHGVSDRFTYFNQVKIVICSSKTGVAVDFH